MPRGDVAGPWTKRSAALVLVADGPRCPERCAFCDLTDLLDDWGLLNHQTGGSSDRGEN